MKPTITVIGAGRMGSALVRAFLAAGYSTQVWNRTGARCAALAREGAHVAPSVLEAVRAADIVIVNVSEYAVSDGLLRTRDVTQQLRGKTLVQLTSGSPALAREGQSWAREHDIEYLDGAIMATPGFIATPGCTILYSGARHTFERVRSALLVLGDGSVLVSEDVGHASALDSALLAALWGALFGVLQGAAVCQAERLPLAEYERYLKAIAPMLEAAVSDVTSRARERRFSGQDSEAAVAAHHWAVQHLTELCSERGLDTTLPHAFQSLLAGAVAAGHAQDDFAVVLRGLIAPDGAGYKLAS